MSQDITPPTGPVDPNPSNEKPKKKPKRRLLLKIVGGLVVLVILLVLLLPTIASMGFVKDIVVNQVNSGVINGKVSIQDWSIGWTSGVHVTGVKVLDEDGKLVAEVGQIDCPISLLKAAGGNIDIGDTRITGVNPNVIRYADGSINILKLLKPTPPSNKPAGKLPNIKGSVHIEGNTGTIEDQQFHAVENIDSLVVDVKIPDINQPIEESVTLKHHLNSKDFGTLQIDGTASAIQGNMVDVDHLAASQVIQISGMDFSAVNAILKQLSVQTNNPSLDLQLTGKMDGKITANVKSMEDISAGATISVAGLSAGGAGLGGDTVQYQNVNLTMNASVAGKAVKLDMPITAATAAGGAPDQIKVSVDSSHDTLQQTGAVVGAIMVHLLNPNAPAQTIDIPGKGTISASVDVDVANLVNEVPNTVHLSNGVKLTGGRFATSNTITIDSDNVVVDSESHITNVAGTNNGQPVKLDDFNATFGIEAAGGAQSRLHKPNVSISNGFLTVKGGGDELGKVAFDGSMDFGALQKQLSQFVNLDDLLKTPAGSHVVMAGTTAFHAETNGDLLAQKSTVTFAANAKVNNLVITGLGQQSIQQPNFTASIGGDLDVDKSAAKPLQDINNLKLTANSPAIEFDAGATAKFDGPFGVTLPSFTINKGTIDLAVLQQEFGGLVSFITKQNNSPRIVSGKLILAGQGKFDSTTFAFAQPLSLHIDPVDVSMPNASGAAQTVHLAQVDISLNGNGTVDAAAQTTTLKPLTLQASIGQTSSPVFLAAVSVDGMVSANSVNATSIQLTHFDGDIAGLQTQFAPALKAFLPAAPATTQPSQLQQIANQTLVATSGKFTAAMSATASYQNGAVSFAITQPFTANISNLTVVRDGKPTKIVSENLTAVADASATSDSQKQHVGLKSIALKLGNSVGEQLNVNVDPANNFQATVAGSSLSAQGGFNLVNADFPGLLAMASLFLTPEQDVMLQKVVAGKATGSVKFLPGDGGSTTATVDVTINQFQLSGKQPDDLHIIATGNLSGDGSTVSNAGVTVTSTLGKSITVANGKIFLGNMVNGARQSPAVFDMLQNADIDIEQLNLPRIEVLVSVLGQIDENALPATISAGAMTLSVHLERKGSTSVANLKTLALHGLAVSKGKDSYSWPNDITLAALATMDTVPNQSILQQLAKVTVSGLGIDLGMVKVATPANQSLVLTGLDNIANISVNGAVAIDGDIEPAARIAEVFADQPKNTYPYTGKFHFDESIQKTPASPDLIVAGGGMVSNFQVLNPAATRPSDAIAFAEKEIELQNGCRFDPNEDSILIDPAHPISVALKSTGAASVGIVGGVHDMQNTRKLDDTTAITIDYDVAKLWTIIKPLVPPAQLAQIADLEISGTEHRVIKITGSYPANEPLTKAVRAIAVAGSVGVGHVSTNGIAVDNLSVSINLTDGKLTISTPTPASCNGGTLDMGTMVVDLTVDPMMLSMPGVDEQHSHYVLKNVALNQKLAQSMVGKFLDNPLFVDTKSATGFLDLSIQKVQTVPLSAAAELETATNPGVAELHFSVRQLHMGSGLLSLLPGWNNGLAAEINNASVLLGKGLVTEDTTVMLNGNQPMRVWGVVGLQSKQFKPMTMSIPTMLFGSMIPGQYQAYLPDSVVVPMKGDISHPTLELDKVVGKLITDAATKALLGGVTGQSPSGGQQQNPVGGLLNGLLHH